MIDDPVVLILCEAAARGRHLRQASEQASLNGARLEVAASDTQPIDPATDTATPQYGKDAIGKESLI